MLGICHVTLEPRELWELKIYYCYWNLEKFTGMKIIYAGYLPCNLGTKGTLGTQNILLLLELRQIYWYKNNLC